MTPKTIGLIAGNGRLPFLIAERLEKDPNYRLVVAAHHQETPPELAGHVAKLCWVHLGQFKRILSFFKQEGVEWVLLAGGVGKFRIWRLRPDRLALQLVARLYHLNDDHLLRTIANEIEKHGMQVKGIPEFLPELLPQAGILSQRQPTPAQWNEIGYAWQIAKAVGRLDIGQGIVTRQKAVVAVEAMEGTDAMLQRAGLLAHGQGIFIKVAKPEQDQRLDLPTIGPNTIKKMHECGIEVVAIEAQRTIILDPQQTLALADRLGIGVVACQDQDFALVVDAPSTQWVKR